MSPSDEEVIALVCGGETDQFEVLVHRYQDYICGLASRQLQDAHTARDVAQEIFVKAYTALTRFRGESSFRTWLTRIAMNHLSNFIASKQWRARSSATEFDPERHAGSETPKEHRDPQELMIDVLKSEVLKLPKRSREVLTLCAIEGKTYLEASQILNIPYGTVCSRMNNALSTLKKKMKESVL